MNVAQIKYYTQNLIFFAGCPKKNKTGFLLRILASKYGIFKLFFTPSENRYSYANFEYQTTSEF